MNISRISTLPALTLPLAKGKELQFSLDNSWGFIRINCKYLMYTQDTSDPPALVKLTGTFSILPEGKCLQVLSKVQEILRENAASRGNARGINLTRMMPIVAATPPVSIAFIDSQNMHITAALAQSENAIMLQVADKHWKPSMGVERMYTALVVFNDGSILYPGGISKNCNLQVNESGAIVPNIHTN